MVRNLPLFLDGDFVESKSKKTLEVTNPLSQEILCQVPCATTEEIDQAVSSASKAFLTLSCALSATGNLGLYLAP